MTDKAPRTLGRRVAAFEAVMRFIPDSWDDEKRRNFGWRLEDYGRAVEAEVDNHLHRHPAASPPPVDALADAFTWQHIHLTGSCSESHKAQAKEWLDARLTESSDPEGADR